MQELDDICHINNWILPSYKLSQSDGKTLFFILNFFVIWIYDMNIELSRIVFKLYQRWFRCVC